MIFLALRKFQDAKDLVEDFLNFNDNTVARKLFYQAMNAVLSIILNDELDLDDFLENMVRMYGAETMKNVVGSVNGEVRFFGLTPTSMKLEGLDKHLKLIESYKKLHRSRAAVTK